MATITDLITDDVFISRVNVNIRQIREQRYNRPAPKEGYRYKRDWYDRMTEQKALTSNYFLANIQAIWRKQSKLSSEFRSIIQYVCDKSLTETMDYYRKQREANEQEKANQHINSSTN